MLERPALHPRHRSGAAPPRSDGFPSWPEFDNPHFGMYCEWRVCAKDDGDLIADELTAWLDNYDEAKANLERAPAVYNTPPYDDLWIEARWTTAPERVK